MSMQCFVKNKLINSKLEVLAQSSGKRLKSLSLTQPQASLNIVHSGHQVHLHVESLPVRQWERFFSGARVWGIGKHF